jgi:hypothetical protein
LPAGCDDQAIPATRHIDESTPALERLEELLADAAVFFEAYLWESEKGRAARGALAKESLDEPVIRAFGVGYAPIGPYVLMNHLRGLGYSTDELVQAGLVNRSARGGIHAHFRSRLMFPVRDRDGQVLGFAGLGTHLGPSWALWITSPETACYRRSEAVFGIDRAASEIARSKTAQVRPDCIEVLREHQEGNTNAVTVHTSWVTHEQIVALGAGVRGGVETLELDLPPGMSVDSQDEPALEVVRDPGAGGSGEAVPASARADPEPRYLVLKRLGIVTATALAAMNVWTGAPLFAVWVGSQVQHKSLLSMRGVFSVIAVLAVLAFLLGWALSWLSAKYDELTGRPATAGQTSPWHRSKRGDRVQDIRSRYGISAPEKVVVACVVAGVLAFEVWFFFFAGSSI